MIALACPHCGEAVVERRPMSRRESELVDALCGFIGVNERQPTFAEIGEMMGWSSLATVNEYMHRLESKGYLIFSPELGRRQRARMGWELVA